MLLSVITVASRIPDEACLTTSRNLSPEDVAYRPSIGSIRIIVLRGDTYIAQASFMLHAPPSPIGSHTGAGRNEVTTQDDLASLWPGRPRAGIRRKAQENVSFSVHSIQGFASAGGRPSMESPVNLLPQSERGDILFTTRNRKLAVRLASPFVVDVFEPDTETCIKLLEKALLRKGLLENSNKTITLLEQLMFLPLAISQAAAYINSNDIELPDYLTLLKEQESDVINLLSEDFGDDGRYQDIQNPVATTWLISFQQIQQFNPLAADYLSFMACISPRDIPQSLLPKASSRKQKIEAIGLLKAFSFVSEQANNHALSLHRLVHLSTRNWLRRQQQFSQIIQKTADRLNQVFPTNYYKNQKAWREYLPHALSLVGELDFQQKREEYIILIQNIGRCLQTDGRYNEAVVLFEDIVKLQQRERGDNDVLTLTSMANLASTYRHQGRWKEAEGLEVQVLEISRRALGPEHPHISISMGNLASTYRNQGRWKEAEELEVQVLENRKRVLGLGHPDTLASMANLAYTLYSKENIPEAVVLMERCVELRGRLLGTSHPHTINAAQSLRKWKGIVYLSSNRHQSPVQAENDQSIKDIVQDRSPSAVALYRANSHGEPLNPHRYPIRPVPRLRVLLEAHPLLLAFPDGSPVMRGQCDLHEVD